MVRKATAKPSVVISLPLRYPRFCSASAVHVAPPCSARPRNPVVSGSPALAWRSIANIAGVSGFVRLVRSNPAFKPMAPKSRGHGLTLRYAPRTASHNRDTTASPAESRQGEAGYPANVRSPHKLI